MNFLRRAISAFRSKDSHELSTRVITCIVDDLDYRIIMDEINLRCRQQRILPDGESDTIGAHLADMVRDLREYRDLFDRDREES